MTTVQEHPDTATFIENIKRNYSRWGFREFLQHTGLSDDMYGVRKFREFKRLAESFGQFDDRMLALFFSRPA